MTVVTIPSALLGDARCVASTAPVPARPCDIEQARHSIAQPRVGTALATTLRHLRAFRTQTQPRPHIFAYYLEETCRLLAAGRGLSHTMSMRFPRAAANEAATTRLFIDGQ